MNDYEAKLEARRERHLERVRKARRESERRLSGAHKMAEAIPFGQPILVGHHSEKRDRNYRAKIDNNFRRGFEASEKADYYTQKAASVGAGGISSDDPEAVTKLRDKLAGLQQLQARMKAANAAIRKGGTDDEKIARLVAVGLNEMPAREALKPDFMGRIGFPDYALTNNNANIRRIKQRIEQLEVAANAQPSAPQQFAGFKIVEDDNRVQIVFPGKPAAEVRAVLKSNGFKWSPSRNAWVRFLNNAGRAAAEYAAQKIRELTPPA